MGKNRNPGRDIDRILSDIKKKHALIEGEINELVEKTRSEVMLPISIFNEKLGMLEAASLYLKDELKLSFNEIAKLLKRNYKTIWTSYNQAKKKLKNER